MPDGWSPVDITARYYGDGSQPSSPGASTRLFARQVRFTQQRGRLRHSPPEVAVMAEEDAGAAGFELREAVERGIHRRAVVHVLRQPPPAPGAAEIAGIGGQHDLAGGKTQFQRLVSRGVTVGR